MPSVAVRRYRDLTDAENIFPPPGLKINSDFDGGFNVSIQRTDSAKKESSNKLNRHVGMYSLAAAVAGVSMLALAEPAQGEVVVTKKTIPIPNLGYSGGVALDLNHDGKTDFTFFNATSFYNGNDFGSAIVWMAGGSVVGQQHPSALMRGANIGPSAPFIQVNSYSVRIEAGYGVQSGSDRLVGDWGGNPKNRYLGVRFLIDGQTHYGWVRSTIITEPGTSWSATITGYAYETVANKPIKAGTAATAAANVEASHGPAGPSLGMLAAGAEAMPLWRRDETAASK